MRRFIPAQGVAVRDPSTMAEVPTGGMDVPTTAYWCRRVIDGDGRWESPQEQAARTGGEKPASAKSAKAAKE